jgi:hypothetical protein
MRERSVEDARKEATEYANTDPIYGLNRFDAVDGDALSTLIALAKHVTATGGQIAFVLMPYHPIVARTLAADRRYRAVEQAQEAIRGLATEMRAPVTGSYFPMAAGCSEEEFIDGMHARAPCLSRVIGGLSGFF